MRDALTPQFFRDNPWLAPAGDGVSLISTPPQPATARLMKRELPNGKPFEFEVAQSMFEIVAKTGKKGCFTSTIGAKLSEGDRKKLQKEYDGVNGFVENILGQFSAVKVGTKGGQMKVTLTAIPAEEKEKKKTAEDEWNEGTNGHDPYGGGGDGGYRPYEAEQRPYDGAGKGGLGKGGYPAYAPPPGKGQPYGKGQPPGKGGDGRFQPYETQ